MADSQSVVAYLSAKDSGMVKTLNEATGACETLGQRVRSGLSFGVLTGVGQAAFNTLKSGAVNLIGEINSASVAWQTFEGNMRMFGKSEEDIAGVKKELQSFAEETIYSSSDMAQTYAQLEAVGTKSTLGLVKGFGGLAAAAENPQQAMKTLSTQATQMAAKPTVAWQDFKLMLEQTPAGIAAVAKEMGMTTTELVSAVQDGTVKTDEFFAAIEKVGTSDAFTNLATEYKSVGQAMDGLQETVGNKLTPAFDMLSEIGIGAIEGIINEVGKIDGEATAAALSDGIAKAKPYWDAFCDIASKVGEVIGKVTQFFLDNSESISKALPYIIGAAGAFKALQVVNRVAPGMARFASSISSMISGGISSLGKKLFGVAAGQKATGSAAASSSAQMLASAKAFLMIGAGVLMAAAGFSLLAYSAIELAAAGAPAIAVMAGLVIAVSALTIAIMFMMRSITASPAQLTAMGTALLALGAAVLMVGAGFTLMAFSAIALSNAGAGAIAIMAAMILVMVGLAVGAAMLGTALTAGAVGFIAFGAAITLVGVGALLAATGLAIITGLLPMLVQYGASGAGAILMLSVAMLAFGAAALVAGAGAIVLGAGLLVAGVGAAMLGAAVLVLAVGAVAAAGAMALISMVLPRIIDNAFNGMMAFFTLSAGLAVFSAAAVVAGAGALVFGAGLLVVGAALALCAVSVLLLAAGILLVAAGAITAAMGFSIMAAMIPAVIAVAFQSLLAFTVMGAALAVFAAAALVAGAAALVLGAGMMVVAVAVFAVAAAVLLLGVAVLTLSLGMLTAALSIQMLAAALPLLAAQSVTGSMALIMLGGALVVFGAGAMVAGAGALVLGAGLALVAVSMVVLSAATAVTAAAVLVLMAGTMALCGGLMMAAAMCMMISASFALVAGSSMLLVAAFTVVMAMSVALSAVMMVTMAAMLALMAGALGASAGVIAFGAAMMVAFVGTLLMATALLMVDNCMSGIAKKAKAAEKSLNSMKNSINIVEQGLKGLGDMAEGAMNALFNVFKGAVGDAKAAALELCTGFISGMQTGFLKLPPITLMGVMLVVTALNAGAKQARAAGANISRGFAMGMLSQLAIIKAAAAQMAAAADKAVRAKAKIKSPSRMAAALGSYWGEGFAGGLSDTARDVWNAAQRLVQIPQIATPQLDTGYAGELSGDYSYTTNAEYTIVVPFNLDGKEFARSTASYTQAELDRQSTRDSRKKGRV